MDIEWKPCQTNNRTLERNDSATEDNYIASQHKELQIGNANEIKKDLKVFQTINLRYGQPLETT